MEAQATYNRKNGYKKPEPDAGLEQYVFGKVQPQALPLEEAVLGALMLDRDALMMVADVLKPESFYTEAHQHIYRAITRLFNAGNPVDILTVTEALRSSGDLEKVGGAYYIAELSSRISSSANIEYHGRIIHQKFVARSIISLCTRSLREAYEETADVFNLLDEMESALMNTRSIQVNGAKALVDLTMPVLKQAEAAQEARKAGGVVGVPSGIRELDAETGGFRDSDLTVIAARPGMGKTAMLNTVALNAAKSGQKAGIMSLEMSSAQLVMRMVSSEARVDSRLINSGKLSDEDWKKMQEAVEKINRLPVWIDDTPALNILELRARARRLKALNGINILMVDYLQLMSAADRAGNREQQVAEISRGLKALAKELNIPVIALAQLSRAVETRGGDKRPNLSDLRESGAIEQDSDNVYFLYRPEYYDITEIESGPIEKGYTEVIIKKSRHGRLCHAVTYFLPEYTVFKDREAEAFSTAPDYQNAQPFTMPRHEPPEDMPF